jgi:hypothetical protein
MEVRQGLEGTIAMMSLVPQPPLPVGSRLGFRNRGLAAVTAQGGAVGRRLGGHGVEGREREEEGAVVGFEGDSMEIHTNEGVAGGDRVEAREGRRWATGEGRRWPHPAQNW